MQRYPAITLALFCALVTSTPGLSRDEIRPGEHPALGGELIAGQDRAWQVTIGTTIRGDILYCAGAVIATRWVVTAAHCLHRETSPSDVRVRLPQAGAQWIGVETIVAHELHDLRTNRYDIALLKLESPVPDGSAIAFYTGELTPGMPLEVTRWAGRQADRTPSMDLVQATVPYIATDTCNVRDLYNGAIGPEMLCAGERSLDACQSELGGPLVLQRPNDPPLLVGLAAWSFGCARKLPYGTYTRVAYLRDWILHIIQSDP